MKKIFILLVLSGSFLACKKEPKTPNTNNTNTTDTTKTSSNSFDTTKYVTNGIVSIGKPIGKIGSGVTDLEGNKYKTVIIGTQEWMGENLKVIKYSDGTTLPNVTDNKEWSELSTGAWSYYNNDASNNAKFGKLYNWYAVSPTTNGDKNVCPTGWHVPKNSEWNVLIDYLGGINNSGGKMKEVGITSWNSPNTDATNISLFSALPDGSRFFGNGSFSSFGSFGHWWSSTEGSFGIGMACTLYSYSGIAGTLGNYMRSGFSVRCLKD
jgi:uncharacterized protein (TIGR02145 family)